MQATNAYGGAEIELHLTDKKKEISQRKHPASLTLRLPN
jgi:hypothetical protein